MATVVAEAGRRGVQVLAPCVNESEAGRWTVSERENEQAIRCSLAYVRGLGTAAAAVEGERAARGSYTSLPDFCRRCDFLTREQLEWLVLSGALDSLLANRRQALWALPALHRGGNNASKNGVTGQTAAELEVAPVLPPDLPEFTQAEAFLRECQALGFSPAGHPMLFHRERLVAEGVRECGSLQATRAGERVTLAGLVICPHRPPTAQGTVFFTLEDETGLAQVIVAPDVYERIGSDVYSHVALVVTGRAEGRGSGVNLLAEQTLVFG